MLIKSLETDTHANSVNVSESIAHENIPENTEPIVEENVSESQNDQYVTSNPPENVPSRRSNRVRKAVVKYGDSIVYE